MGHNEQQIKALGADEQALLDTFLDEHALFYGPDPEIMRNHSIGPRSPVEAELLEGELDPHALNLVRGRLHAALDETYDMVEQMGTAPGAKWGDLVTAVYTANGDLSAISPKGVVVFSGVCHYPLKFIAKYWTKDPTVGLHDGDGFIHNDSRYGNIHNTDQSMIMPVFHEGELICWVSSTIHEGENGACEPGGMPAAAESKWDEGLKMPPFRIVENNQVRRDLLTFLQNSVRDPKLQYEDVKVKLHACLRLIERIRAVIAEYGKENLIACLRKSIEDVDVEVRRRIRALPDGTVRTHAFIDGTLRENALLKYNLTVTVKGERMILDVRGSSPEFLNRSQHHGRLAQDLHRHRLPALHLARSAPQHGLLLGGRGALGRELAAGLVLRRAQLHEPDPAVQVLHPAHHRPGQVPLQRADPLHRHLRLPLQPALHLHLRRGDPARGGDRQLLRRHQRQRRWGAREP